MSTDLKNLGIDTAELDAIAQTMEMDLREAQLTSMNMAFMLKQKQITSWMESWNDVVSAIKGMEDQYRVAAIEDQLQDLQKHMIDFEQRVEELNTRTQEYIDRGGSGSLVDLWTEMVPTNQDMINTLKSYHGSLVDIQREFIGATAQYN